MKPVALRHILEHGPMLRALGHTALGALRGPRAGATPVTPGPWIETEVRPPSPALVRAFVAFSGGEPASYRGVLPPHLFPQWTLAAASRALEGVPYPLAKIVNAGVALAIRDGVAAGEPLAVRARLDAIDESPTRVVMTTRIETGTKHVPDALVAELRTYVPLARPANGAARPKERSEPPRVPDDARELALFRLAADAGLEFAKLTGDFNPIHWIAPYARSAGFRGCILHGFGSFALATSAVVRGVLSGDVGRLRTIEARFTRPLLLPGSTGIYVTDANELYAGDAPGGAAYLAGRFQIGDRT
jgi:acyl dehydratase